MQLLEWGCLTSRRDTLYRACPLTLPKVQADLISWTHGFRTSEGQFRGAWIPKFPALVDDDQGHP